MLTDKIQDNLDEEGKHYLGVLTSSSQAMVRLIKSLMAFARLGQGGFKREECSIKSIVENVSQNLECMIQDENAEIIIEEDIPSFFCSSVHMVQLFQNLISNAIKYRRPEESPVIRIGFLRNISVSENVLFVQDNGLGIAESNLKSVFLMFDRGQNDSKDVDGDGVGLSICQRIVERHGGNIWAESKLGEGSTFYFTLGDHSLVDS